MITWTLWTKRPASTRFSSPHLVLPKACLRVCTLTGASGSRCRLLRHRFFCTNFFWSISDGQKVFRLDLDPSPIRKNLHIKFGCFMVKITSSAGPQTGSPWLRWLHRLHRLHRTKVRLYCPIGLPVRDPALEEHPKVKELRASWLHLAALGSNCSWYLHVDLDHTLLRITLVCLACELSLVAKTRGGARMIYLVVMQVGYSTALPPQNVHLRPSPAGQKDMFGSVLRCMVLSLVLSRTRLIGSLT